MYCASVVFDFSEEFSNYGFYLSTYFYILTKVLINVNEKFINAL